MALNINKNALMLALSLVLGGTAAFLGNKVIKNRIAAIEQEAQKGKQMVQVVVPVKDLERGATLTHDILAVREVPREFAPASAVTPDKVEIIENQRLVTAVKRGEALLTAHTEGAGNKVFSGILKKGSRALTIPVNDENSVSGMLRPGDRIDLIVVIKSSQAAGGKEMTFPLLSDVPVLATGQATSKADANNKGGERYATVTLEVSPQDADRIIVAQTSGQLKALLRNPEDNLANATRPMTADDLFGVSRSGRTRSIELIVGGGGKAAFTLAPMAMQR
ncbi:MAG TPA: Flp pilus assembly protein CpaB [Noviherbaspirillum sp.]